MNNKSCISNIIQCSKKKEINFRPLAAELSGILIFAPLCVLARRRRLASSESPGLNNPPLVTQRAADDSKAPIHSLLFSFGYHWSNPCEILVNCKGWIAELTHTLYQLIRDKSKTSETKATLTLTFYQKAIRTAISTTPFTFLPFQEIEAKIFSN